MEEINLIVVVASAFGAVLILLSALAGLMYLLAFIFPDRTAEAEAQAVVVAEVSADEAELPVAEDQPDAREHAAVMTAVLMMLEDEAKRQAPSVLPEQPGRSWKLMGRLERMNDPFSARGWKRQG